MLEQIIEMIGGEEEIFNMIKNSPMLDSFDGETGKFFAEIAKRYNNNDVTYKNTDVRWIIQEIVSSDDKEKNNKSKIFIHLNIKKYPKNNGFVGKYTFKTLINDFMQNSSDEPIDLAEIKELGGMASMLGQAGLTRKKILEFLLNMGIIGKFENVLCEIMNSIAKTNNVEKQNVSLSIEYFETIEEGKVEPTPFLGVFPRVNGKATDEKYTIRDLISMYSEEQAKENNNNSQQESDK